MRTNSSYFFFFLISVLLFTACYRATKDSASAKDAMPTPRMMPGEVQEPMIMEDELLIDTEQEKPQNTESYDIIKENTFQSPLDHPLSTFSVDVDYASYSNTRRFLMNGSLPPKDAVRIEEFINYFSYDYPAPEGAHPFSVNTEMTACPWQPNHQLVQIGLKGKDIPKEALPPSNLVFLLDVSGSMDAPNKLPLLKSAFKMLVNQLDNDDYVSVVVYAGASGVVLEPTSCDEKSKIINALEELSAGGSTAGAEGLELAYKLAQENFRKDANNRILLATDGDFNVGPSSDAEMQRMIESKRDAGIFLSVLGFGMGNYKDSKMEAIADNGNGNYAYIDNLREAQKVLVNELTSTLFTIAKDVKIQVEFNPAKVQAYRLIGYENRLLNAEDFNDDKKDAGEIGVGHTVTAIYEIVPTGVKLAYNDIDPLKYQERQISDAAKNSKEWMTIKLRYKQPEATTSTLLQTTIEDTNNASMDMNFASAVAGFGMLLRESKYKGDCNYDLVLELARSGKGEDPNGYRGEFIQLVELAKSVGN